MIAAVAYKEYDEIPTILTNKAIDMFNAVLAPYNIPPIPKEQYDLNYEFINKIVETGEKFMPTDIIIKKGVTEYKKGADAGIDISAGLGAQVGVFDNSITTPAKTDTMETTQKYNSEHKKKKYLKKLKRKKILKKYENTISITSS